MSEDEDRIRSLRLAVEKRQQDKARAEVLLAAAREREQVALAALAEFGVSSLEEAMQLLTRLRADLDQACAAAEQALKEAGG